jgi:hypothetical protein
MPRLPAPLKLTRLLAFALALFPTACAIGVTAPIEDEGGSGNEAGNEAGGSAALAGAGGVPGSAGKPSSGGTAANPFGGTASTGGKAGSGSGGAGGTGGSAKGGAGGSGGTGGVTGGSGGMGGAGSGGTGGGSGCACPKTLTWMDNTVLNWSSGDCLDVSGAKYQYIGTKAQTYANAQCNPTKQEAWCTDSGNDYKFMACK